MTSAQLRRRIEKTISQLSADELTTAAYVLQALKNDPAERRLKRLAREAALWARVQRAEAQVAMGRVTAVQQLKRKY